MSRKHSHLTRLERIWINDPIFFITTNTAGRKKILASNVAAAVLTDEWQRARERHGWAVGRYVIMPEHVDFFCTPCRDAESLSNFMMAWKQWTSKLLSRECRLQSPIWQAEFLDYVLRNEDSYEQRYEYMVKNPVRAGLVSSTDDWPWQGEIERLLLAVRTCFPAGGHRPRIQKPI